MTDLTGRKQLLHNAFVTGSMHLLVVAAGFIVPRQIDDSLGAEKLGVWDLGWATVQYMTMTGLGVAAALNRYTAFFRAKSDIESLSKVTTMAVVWQVCVGLLITFFSAFISWSLPYWIDFSEPETIYEAQIVLFLLGFSLAIKMFFTHTQGLLTGYHYWWIHNSLMSMQDFLLALTMVGILLLDGKLVHLAVAVVVISIIFSYIRLRLVAKYCPDAKIGRRYFDWKIGVEILRYGIKTMVGMASQILVFQTTAVVLIATVNPVALAIFNRGLALIKHTDSIIRKIVVMFVPITSSMLGLNQENEAKGMLIWASQIGMCLTIPPIFLLMLYGDLALYLWMGKDYADPELMFVLSLGSIYPIASISTYSVIAGFNAHGKLSIYSLAITVTVIIISLPILSVTGWSIISIAIMMGSAWTLGKALVFPFFLKIKYKITIWQYILLVILKPVIINAPLMISMWQSRNFVDEQQLLLAFLSLCTGVLTTMILYWFYLLNESIRGKAIKKVRSIKLFTLSN